MAVRILRESPARRISLPASSLPIESPWPDRQGRRDRLNEPLLRSRAFRDSVGCYSARARTAGLERMRQRLDRSQQRTPEPGRIHYEGMMDQEYRPVLRRRDFLRDCAGGLGIIALSQLLAAEGRAARRSESPGAQESPISCRRPKTSSSCSWRADPASSICSIPNPHSPSGTASRCRNPCARTCSFAFIKPTAKVWASQRPFASIRPVGHGVFRLAAAPRLLRGRSLHGPLHVQRRSSIIIRASLLLLCGSPAGRTAVDGLVAALRAGQRIAESAGLRRAVAPGEAAAAVPGCFPTAFCHRLSGRAVLVERRSDSLPLQSRRHHARRAARAAWM